MPKFGLVAHRRLTFIKNLYKITLSNLIFAAEKSGEYIFKGYTPNSERKNQMKKILGQHRTTAP